MMNRMMKLVAVICMMGCAAVQAELWMPPVFSDGMVLQADELLPS